LQRINRLCGLTDGYCDWNWSFWLFMPLMTDSSYAGRHCKSIMIKAHYCYNARASILGTKYKLIGRQKPQTCAEIAFLTPPFLSSTSHVFLKLSSHYYVRVYMYIHIHVYTYIYGVCVRLRPCNDNDLLYHRL